ncbi:DUF1798 family protein [Neobacillus mesonae]|uniref:DUF1798 family protein n=1 Tax=Neobacillus mesonae TaxID=1193713 RepID=UPI00203C2BE0|nr:DUF1798 family protein [Neobacillus mesonae]MCM3566827.1 YppE family protein [Neobacillus mesonae]
MDMKTIELTEKLLHYNNLFLYHYNEVRENGIKQDFYHTIKPFVDEVEALNNEWKISMEKWLGKNDPKHIHLKQVETTAEHIKNLAIQCFFPETSKSRFLNSQRTVEFFLEDVLIEMKKDA